MKHIKTYENLKDKYQVGDFVLINIPYDYSGNHKYTEFINNNIGKLIKTWSVEANRVGEKGDENGLAHYIEIKYNNIPSHIKYMFNHTDDEKKEHNCMMRTNDNYLVSFGKTIEELKMRLSANKYNL